MFPSLIVCNHLKKKISNKIMKTNKNYPRIKKRKTKSKILNLIIIKIFNKVIIKNISIYNK